MPRISVYIKNNKVLDWLTRKKNRSLEIESIILQKIDDYPYATRQEILTMMESMKENSEKMNRLLDKLDAPNQ